MALTDGDLMLVKNETDGHRPFRSSFAVTSGVYYYEVIPVTGEDMRFGWATRQVELSWWNKIGDDDHSIGLELGNEFCIYHKHNDEQNDDKGKYKVTNVSSHNSPPVIGCLIDTCNRQFHFYINGQQVKSPDNVHFSTWPYYATVSLEEEQRCRFNFGQAPFKFAPKYIRFSAFHETSGNSEEYQLAKTIKHISHFWFVHPVIVNQFPLFYCDPEQVECDELVRQFEHIEHNQTTRLDHSVECGRLVQSVIEVLDRKLTFDHDDLLRKWLREAIDKSKNYFEQVKLLELLFPYHQLSITSSNSAKCHNISTILFLILLNSKYNFSNHIVKYFHNLDIFLLHSIEAFQLFINPKLFITDPLKMMNVINFLESFPLPKTKQTLLTDPSLKSTLNYCSEIFGQVSSVSQLYEPSCDLVRLHAGMCARWFRDHVMQTGEKYFPSQSTLNPDDMSEHIKLSSDCLSARNDYGDWKSVRSVCSVSSGIFYYEAVLLTDERMRIGWATKQSDLNEYIGCDKYSIGYEGSYGHEVYLQWKNFYDKSLILNFTSKPRWSVGEVVGCLIDCDIKIFKFYLNGKLVKCRQKIKDEYGEEYFQHFSAEPYHVAVSLDSHQQCYLNLGQCPFRHPPSVKFRTFHNLTTTPPSSPLHSPRLSECYSLVRVLTKHRVELVFDDDKQKESDQLASEILENNELPMQMNSEIDRLRLLQSLISVSKPNLFDTHLSVHSSWIAHFITQSTSTNFAFPDLVAQLLYTFFTLHLTEETAIKHRNVCIVVAAMITTMDKLKARVKLYQQILLYLTQIVTKSDQVTNEWMFLYALVGIGNLELQQKEIEALKSNAAFCRIIETKKNLDMNDPQIFAIQPNLPLMRQSVLVSQWFCKKFLNLNSTTDHSLSKPSSSNLQTLNPMHSGPHLKLSPDLLSARSDRPFESVRSMSCVDSKRYYFEVTLVTNGPMRFGWASENTDLTRGKLGDDEYSIGFDGFNRCVWHRGRSYQVRNVQRWSVRDVVGCMFLAIEKTFHFYLNDEPLNLPFRPHFSAVQSYYAAASLTTFQQCRFAFDQIQYPTKSPSFLLMNSLRRASDSLSRSTINIANSVITNTIINAGSILARNINMRQVSYSNLESTINSLNSDNNRSEAAQSSFDERDEDNFDEQNN